MNARITKTGTSRYEYRGVSLKWSKQGYLMRTESQVRIFSSLLDATKWIDSELDNRD